MWRYAELEAHKTVLLEKENVILDHAFFFIKDRTQCIRKKIDVLIPFEKIFPGSI